MQVSTRSANLLMPNTVEQGSVYVEYSSDVGVVRYVVGQVPVGEVLVVPFEADILLLRGRKAGYRVAIDLVPSQSNSATRTTRTLRTLPFPGPAGSNITGNGEEEEEATGRGPRAVFRFLRLIASL